MVSEFQTNPQDAQPLDIEPAPCPTEDPEFAGDCQAGRIPRPWGPWATIGWTLLCIVVILAGQIAVLIIFVMVRLATNRNPRIDDLLTNGNVLALSTLANTLTVVGLIALLDPHPSLPRPRLSRPDWPPARSVLIAVAGLAILLCTSDLISYMLGRPLAPPCDGGCLPDGMAAVAFARLGHTRSAGRGDPLSRLSVQGHRRIAAGPLSRSW